MKRQHLAVALVGLVVVASGGCSGTRAGIDVGYPEQAINRSVLATAPPRRIAIGPVADGRMETSRIGSRSKDGAPIATSRPVTSIVGDALAAELVKNGHSAVSGNADIALAVTVEAFWLDVVTGYPGTQYVGRVAFAVTLEDGRTGDSLLTRRYVGIKRRDVEKESDAAWTEVMDVALARAIHDFATDPDVAATLARGATAQR